MSWRRLRRISTTSQEAHAPAPAGRSSGAEKPVGARFESGSAGALMAIVWPRCRPSAVNRPPSLSHETATLLIWFGRGRRAGELLADDRPDEAHEDEDAGEQADK